MISAISTLDLTRDRFMYDVIDGLSRPWKRLPPKYFYDEAGSRLFDRITGLDEYYLTRSGLAERRQDSRQRLNIAPTVHRTRGILA